MAKVSRRWECFFGGLMEGHWIDGVEGLKVGRTWGYMRLKVSIKRDC